jgi:GT2 family glycosyltransferase
MTNERKISVVVSTYNALDDLGRCVDSLRSQSYDSLEIVIVDDASTDGTFEFLKRCESEVSDIKVIRNQVNLGVAGARNEGIRNASGDIIAFTDADCIAERNWISELVKIYEREDVAAVGGRIIDAGTDSLWSRASTGLNHVAGKEGFVGYIQGCNMSYDSEVLRKFMFNDELKYGYEETLLCDQLVQDGYKIYYTPSAVVHHRHRKSLKSLLKQKYLRGVSSVWYRKKKHDFFMFKRHFALLLAVCMFPFYRIKFMMYGLWVFALLFLGSLVRDEIMLYRRSALEFIVLSPFIIVLELAHFYGSCVGLIKFRLLKSDEHQRSS